MFPRSYPVRRSSFRRAAWLILLTWTAVASADPPPAAIGTGVGTAPAPGAAAAGLDPAEAPGPAAASVDPPEAPGPAAASVETPGVVQPSASPSADLTLPTAARFNPALSGGAWLLTQLVPSPLLIVGDEHVGGGLRWQVTPLLYSFGIADRPLRTLIVSPIARHSGSIELHVSPEWSCCTAAQGTSWLLRSGARVYLPLIEHGEVLSWSLGGAYYLAADGGGVSGDVGIYSFNGVLGLHVTLSPWLRRRQFIAALAIRYF